LGNKIWTRRFGDPVVSVTHQTEGLGDITIADTLARMGGHFVKERRSAIEHEHTYTAKP